MSLKKAKIIFYVLFGVGCIFNMMGATDKQAIWYYIGAIIFIIACIFHLIFHRCPYCKRHLRDDFGDYCKYCGCKIKK